jgi:hypothetical protein
MLPLTVAVESVNGPATNETGAATTDPKIIELAVMLAERLTTPALWTVKAANLVVTPIVFVRLIVPVPALSVNGCVFCAVPFVTPVNVMLWLPEEVSIEVVLDPPLIVTAPDPN